MNLYEAIEIICEDYCKYPDVESGNKLADICDKCPMNKCEELRWAGCKDKPTTQTETQNSNLTFEKRTMRDCYNCKKYETEGECIECHYEPKDEPMKTADYCDICKRDICEDCIADATNPYCVPSHYEINYEPKDEPQTEVETMSCAECKHRPIGAEICEEACHYEPQTDWHYDEQAATWYPYKHEDEPQQKSCATCKHALGNWDGESNNCGRCCGADRRFYEPKDEPQIGEMMTEEEFDSMLARVLIGKDEPQTERSSK